MSVQASSSPTNHEVHRTRVRALECTVCGSKAIGVNFGAVTCAPCKAFFRRNAKRTGIVCWAVASRGWDGEIRGVSGNCSDVRRCVWCRLHRCFRVGMRAELIRTEEEKQRYRLLIESNRRRKHPSQPPPSAISREVRCRADILTDEDRRLLSNIVCAYDHHCIQFYTRTRQMIFEQEKEWTDHPSFHLQHHQAVRVNSITALLSFLSSIPAIRSLESPVRFYLCQHNALPVLMPHLFELDQACFTHTWQNATDDAAAEHVYGPALFEESRVLRRTVDSVLINDPIVTRLWLLALFCSSPLFCFYSRSLPHVSSKNRMQINQLQDTFVHLLWNYLLHRHGPLNAVRIYANLIRTYLLAQRFSQSINQDLRTRSDLVEMHEVFNRALVFKDDC